MRIAKSALPLLFLLAISSSPQQLKSFRELQWKYPHVRTASKEKDEVLKKRFEEKAVTYPPRAIFCGPSNKKAFWIFGQLARQTSLTCSCTSIEFALRRDRWGPSAALATNRCRKAFTSWIASIPRAISS